MIALVLILLILIVQFAISKSLVPAFAATAEYTFFDDSEYYTGDNAQVDGGEVSFRATWYLEGADFGYGSTSMPSLVATKQDGVVISVLDNGAAYRSTDYGSNWFLISGLTAIEVKDIVQTASTLVAVGGDNSPNPGIYYSTNNGQSWVKSQSNIGPNGMIVAATAFENSNTVYAVSHAGYTFKSTDGGINWISASGSGIEETREIVLSSGGRLFQMGSDEGIGVVRFSDDGGIFWYPAELPVETSEMEFTVNAYHNGRIYISDRDVLLSADAGGPLDSNRWTEHVLNSGYFILSDLFSDKQILFASIYESASGSNNGQLVSSYNDGATWQTHEIPDSSMRGLGVTRLSNNGPLLWIVRDGGSLDSYSYNPWSDYSWVIPKAGFGPDEISRIFVESNPATESSNPSVAFGFEPNNQGTWYYFSKLKNKWESSNGDNRDIANPISELTPQILKSFDDAVPLAGPIYVKMYLTDSTNSPNRPLMVLNGFAVEYGLPNVVTNEIYVSSDTIASDNSGDGSKNKPYRTIGRALRHADDNTWSDEFKILLMGPVYELSEEDVDYTPYENPNILIKNRLSFLISSPPDNKNQTVVVPSPKFTETGLRFDVRGNLEVNGLRFEDFVVENHVNNGAYLAFTNNNFIGKNANNCDRIDIRTAAWARIKFVGNVLESSDTRYKTECYGLRLEGDSGLSTNQIANNTFRVHPTDSSYQMIIAGLSNLNILNNKFVSEFKPRDTKQLIGIMVLPVNKPAITKNDFSEFTGIPILYLK